MTTSANKDILILLASVMTMVWIKGRRIRTSSLKASIARIILHKDELFGAFANVGTPCTATCRGPSDVARILRIGRPIEQLQQDATAPRRPAHRGE